MNDCNRCLYATRDGGCASWGCNFISMEEAEEAWKNWFCGGGSEKANNYKEASDESMVAQN